MLSPIARNICHIYISASSYNTFYNAQIRFAQLGEKISFQIVIRNSMVYGPDVNPCVYVAATLKGSGLRGESLNKLFSKSYSGNLKSMR